MERCAACHGEFGESAGRWPILSGGAGTLASRRSGQDDRLVLALCVDGVGLHPPRHAVRQCAVADATTSSTRITAYVLYLNDVIKDEDFELNEKNFTSIKLPNQPNFIDDDREVAEKEFWRKTPCMKNCTRAKPRSPAAPARST